jgi:hypothetical protein
MLSSATQIPDKTSKSFIVGSCVVGSLRYKCQFAWFIPGVAGRGAADCGECCEVAGVVAEALEGQHLLNCYSVSKIIAVYRT